MRNKRLPIIIISIAIGFIIMVFVLMHTEEKKKRTLSDTLIPTDTAVIIHASTFSSGDMIAKSPESILYFYNSNGKLISQANEPEEVCGDFIMESSEGIGYFFKNHTTLTTSTNAVSKDNESGTIIHSIKFGPSAIGYIEDMNVYYSLVNVGQHSKEEPYINIIRIVSDEENYDVIIPYYLENISYDKLKKQFICEISPMNDIENSSFCDYVIVSYDESLKKFVLDETVHHLNNDMLAIGYDKFNSDSMVKSNILYNVVVMNHTEKENGLYGDLILSVYDLEADKLVENKMLIKEYDLGKYGGMLIGSDHFPVIERCNQLYVFASTGQVFIITDEDTIEELQMPYQFDNKLHLGSPDYTKYVDAMDFTGSEVKVGDDGEIYILNLYRDKKLRIHRLKKEGEYELI